MNESLQTDPSFTALRLEAFLPYRLNRLSEVVSRRFAAVYRDRYGLTRPEWRALATLGQFDRMTATAIGHHSSMHKTKVSRAVAGLSGRKWLIRETDNGDRRVEHLALTREGRRVYAELAQFAATYAEELKMACGPEAYAALDAGLIVLERAFGLHGSAQAD